MLGLSFFSIYKKRNIFFFILNSFATLVTETVLSFSLYIDTYFSRTMCTNKQIIWNLNKFEKANQNRIFLNAKKVRQRIKKTENFIHRKARKLIHWIFSFRFFFHFLLLWTVRESVFISSNCVIVFKSRVNFIEFRLFSVHSNAQQIRYFVYIIVIDETSKYTQKEKDQKKKRAFLPKHWYGACKNQFD